jgi:hypothetical protein
MDLEESCHSLLEILSGHVPGANRELHENPIRINGVPAKVQIE